MRASTAIIAAVRDLAEQGAGVDDFIPHLHELVSGSPLSMASVYEAGIILHRATIHHRCLPSEISELWYPPATITRLGRANRQGNPMFYCASDPACVFYELDAVRGQIGVRAEWRTTRRMILHDLGYAAEVLARANSRRELPERHASFLKTLSPEQLEVRNFISAAFAGIPSQNYALTAAIAEVFLRADELNGIIYPAVANSASTDNLALHPSFVRAGLQLAAAELVRLDEVNPGTVVKGEIICDLQRVLPDGSLEWGWRGVPTDLPPGAGHAMKIGSTVRLLTSREISIEGSRYRVLPGFSVEHAESGPIVRDLLGDTITPER